MNKHTLYDLLMQSDQKLHVLIQYTQKDITDFQSIETGILKGLEKLRQELVK